MRGIARTSAAADRGGPAGPPPQILHLALPEDWAAAAGEGVYRISTRGQPLPPSAFVHCAFEDQLVGVARRYYADLTELVVLGIDVARLRDEVRVEPGADGEAFPHVYGPIPLFAVVRTTTWRRDPDGAWRHPGRSR